MKTPKEQPNPLVKMKEMAAILKIHERTVRSLVRKGEIPAVKIRKSYRFHPEEVIKALTVEAEVKQE